MRPPLESSSLLAGSWVAGDSLLHQTNVVVVRGVTLMQKDEHMSPAQFARLSGLSLGYVYSLLWSGRLQAEKTDGQWRIPPSALQQRQAVSA